MTNELKPSQFSPGAVADGRWTQPPPIPQEWIEILFSRLTAYYGARFADAWRGTELEDVKDVWATELAGYSRQEIARGLEKCKTKDWPPTLPEFLKMCRPPLDPETAYYEAIKQTQLRKSGADTWSHPAIFWASVSIGTSDMLNSNWGSISKRWIAALEKELEKKQWNDVPVAREALPAPGKTSLTAEESKERLEKIYQMLGAKHRMAVA